MSWSLDERWPLQAHQPSVEVAAQHGEGQVMKAVMAGHAPIQQVDQLPSHRRVQPHTLR
jgi:hypothetical protein